MEYILMALFGGGSADWQDIAQTSYDWEKIFNMVKADFGSLENISISDLYSAILDLAIYDIEDTIDKFYEEFGNNDNYKKEVEILKTFDFGNINNYEKSINYLDTHLSLFVPQEIYNILEKVALLNDFENINDNIGFTYVNIEIK